MRLAQEALEQWKHPRFKDVFRLSGWIIGSNQPPSASTDIAISAAGTYDTLVETLRLHGQTAGILPLPDPSSLHSRYPDFFSHAPGFRGIFDSNAGWVDSSEALKVVAKECESMGVEFVTGQRGTVKSLVWNHDHDKVIGVENLDGEVFKADKVVCCLGAYTDTLIDMENQLTAVCSSFKNYLAF